MLKFIGFAFLQEQTFKHYKSLLEDLLSRFHQLQSRIYPPFYPLFTHHVAKVYRAFEPGLHTLTWSSLNIDAYIAKVHRSLDQFEASISSLNTLIAEKIDRILDHDVMDSFSCLFSLDYIRSKLWSPAEFQTDVRAHLHDQAKLIGEKLSHIQTAFQEVEEIFKVRVGEEKSRISTLSTKDIKLNTSTVTNEAMRTFIGFYSEKMICCIQKIIQRSLTTFIELIAVTETKYLIDQTKLIRLLFEGQDVKEQETSIDTHRIRYDNGKVFLRFSSLIFMRKHLDLRLPCNIRYQRSCSNRIWMFVKHRSMTWPTRLFSAKNRSLVSLCLRLF